MLRAAFSHMNDGLALKLEGRPFGALKGVGFMRRPQIPSRGYKIAIPNKLMPRRS